MNRPHRHLPVALFCGMATLLAACDGDGGRAPTSEPRPAADEIVVEAADLVGAYRPARVRLTTFDGDAALMIVRDADGRRLHVDHHPPFEYRWDTSAVPGPLEIAVRGDHGQLVGLEEVAAPQPRPGDAAEQRTFHVAANGDDAADGSPDAPWATLQHAANMAAAGDTVVAANGQYAGFETRRSGRADAPIIFRAGGDEVLLDRPSTDSAPDIVNIEGHDWIVLDGIQVTGAPRAGIRAVEASGVRIVNVTARDNGRWGIFTGFTPGIVIANSVATGSAGEHGIYVSNSRSRDDAPLLQANYAADNAWNGIQLNGDCHSGGDGVIENAVIEDNVIRRNDLKGLSLIATRDARIVNNLIVDNGFEGGAGGIHIVDEPGCDVRPSGNALINNTIVEPRMDGIQFGPTTFSNVVFNNIVLARPAMTHRDDTAVTTANGTDDVDFVAPGRLDYRPHSASDKRGIGRFMEHDAPQRDMAGRTRASPPTMGSLRAVDY